MDKYEYKLRSEEIKDLIAKKEYAEAMVIADTIDWRRVKNIMMLTMVSDLYKINRRYDVSRDILLLAYDRHPGGRTIVYSLCELSIKLGEFVQAIEYYKEFVRVAPNDTGRYILKYKIYDAQEVTLEERIKVLEEFKTADYREKWGYELAFLYHRAGLEQQCVTECDELILTFGEGKYVVKAMELKMLHRPLTPVQQEKYDNRNRKKMSQMGQSVQTGDGQVLVSHETLVPEQPLNVLAADTKVVPGKEIDIQVKTFDANNKYNTMNIQAALADSMKEILADETEAQEAQRKAAEQEQQYRQQLQRQQQLAQLEAQQAQRAAEQKAQAEAQRAEQEAQRKAAEQQAAAVLQNTGEIKEITVPELVFDPNMDTQSLIDNMTAQAAQTAAENSYENLLAMENDGQISLVVPEEEKVEKQITGQLSIEDILSEWEKMKKASEQRSMDDIKQRVMEQTGQIFTDFDKKANSGILAGLEDGSLTGLTAMEQGAEPEEEDTSDKDASVSSDSYSALNDDEFDNESEADTQDETEIQDEYAQLESENQADTDEVEELEDIAEEASVDESIINDIAATLEVSPETVQEEAQTGADASDMTDVSEKLIRTTEKEVTGQEQKPARALTEEEKELFGALIQTDQMKAQIATAIDTVSLASYTGNVIITGEAGAGTLTLAKNLVKSVQLSDNNFSGKVAKISGAALDKKDITATLSKLQNGAIIIEKANGLSAGSLQKLTNYLEQEKNDGIIVIMEDTKLEMRKCLNKNQALKNNFNARIDINAMDNDALVAFARDYAYEQEYSIDNLGILALYTRIAELQSGEHSVNLAEVRDIVDEAIWSANRKNPKHFFAILSGKRYDEEDMIVLREKDFVC